MHKRKSTSNGQGQLDKGSILDRCLTGLCCQYLLTWCTVFSFLLTERQAVQNTMFVFDGPRSLLLFFPFFFLSVPVYVQSRHALITMERSNIIALPFFNSCGCSFFNALLGYSSTSGQWINDVSGNSAGSVTGFRGRAASFNLTSTCCSICCSSRHTIVTLTWEFIPIWEKTGRHLLYFMLAEWNSLSLGHSYFPLKDVMAVVFAGRQGGPLLRRCIFPWLFVLCESLTTGVCKRCKSSLFTSELRGNWQVCDQPGNCCCFGRREIRLRCLTYLF